MVGGEEAMPGAKGQTQSEAFPRGQNSRLGRIESAIESNTQLIRQLLDVNRSLADRIREVDDRLGIRLGELSDQLKQIVESQRRWAERLDNVSGAAGGLEHEDGGVAQAELPPSSD